MRRAAISVDDVSKVFALSGRGGRPVSLLEALRTRSPSANIREVRAVDHVSFSIDEGERVGIIGRNGAGKTTLLSMLSGLSEPTSGAVRVDGDVHAMLSIGAVLREDLTGRQNIYLDASVHGRSRAEIDAVAGQIIDFCELGEFMDRPVHTYSSGMKARLAFSMGAFISPDILIIDETLSVGDASFAEKASRRMREIARGGRIVIVVSHALGSIVEMCTRCLWLDQGRLRMDGDPVKVTQAYEASVREADEYELISKFGRSGEVPNPRGPITIDALELMQADVQRKSTTLAMVPLQISVRGFCRSQSADADIELSITRVDGRRIWHQRLSERGLLLPAHGRFVLRIDMTPFLLGADLYRLDVAAYHRDSHSDFGTRVFEVIDEEGQFGGKPLLFCPPLICARPKGAPRG